MGGYEACDYDRHASFFTSLSCSHFGWGDTLTTAILAKHRDSTVIVPARRDGGGGMGSVSG